METCRSLYTSCSRTGAEKVNISFGTYLKHIVPCHILIYTGSRTDNLWTPNASSGYLRRVGDVTISIRNVDFFKYSQKLKIFKIPNHLTFFFTLKKSKQSLVEQSCL